MTFAATGEREASRAQQAGAAILMPVLAAFLIAGGCSSRSDTPNAAPPPVKTELLAHEAELLKITLSPQAEQRLGIVVIAAAVGTMSRTRISHGEVVAAPIKGGVPITSATDLTALAAAQAVADGAVARARAELDIAETNAKRAEALMREEAGSTRARDESAAALVVARANWRAAEEQRALQGEPIGALGRRGELWLRVPVFAADLAGIDRLAAASVQMLGSKDRSMSARPVSAPPSANAVAGTVDLYYALGPADHTLQLGQRVAVELPLSDGEQAGVVVPVSAILSDIYGGEWVYVRTAPHTYERRRIEVGMTREGRALVRRGAIADVEVVIDGAAELFGTEFGAR